MIPNSIKLSLKLCLLCLFCFAANGLWAQEARPLATDPVQEAKLQSLYQELRCLVCQNQSLADSNAPLAEDLRNEIREMAVAGKSEPQIVAYLVARYGDFVLYKPPVKANTLLLWLGPFVLLLLALLALIWVLRSAKKVSQDVPLDATESKQLAQILNKETP
jgi:cytochrome c-type biogenesis protein CcmH